MPKRHPVVDRLHRSAKVDSRHMTLPLERYAELDGFGAADDVFAATPPMWESTPSVALCTPPA